MPDELNDKQAVVEIMEMEGEISSSVTPRVTPTPSPPLASFRPPSSAGSDDPLDPNLSREAHPEPPYPWTIYQYALIVCLSGFAGGYTIGNIGPTILYIPQVIPLSTLDTTLVVSMVLIGALCGTAVSGMFGDRLGRKPVFLISGSFGIVSSLILAVAHSSGQLIIGRFLAGVAVGAVTVASGLFLAEASPTAVRGRVQGYGHLSGWIGGILAHVIGIGSIYLAPKAWSWRITFALGGLLYVPSIILTFLLLPESPRWLISRGRDKEALELMRKIYGPGREHEVHQEYKTVQKSIGGSTGSRTCGRTRELFRKEYRRPMALSLALQGLQQLSGNNMITFYSSIILHDLGFTRQLSVLMTGVSIIPQAMIIWFVVHTLDKIGRRIPLLVSIMGTGLSLLVMAVVMQVRAHRVSTWLSLAAILLNRIFFSVGLGPLPAVIAAEVLPFNARGKGLAAAVAMGEIFKIVSVTAYLPLTTAVHPSYLYGGLALGMFLGFFYMVTALTETRGTPLDAIHIQPGLGCAGHLSSKA